MSIIRFSLLVGILSLSGCAGAPLRESPPAGMSVESFLSDPVLHQRVQDLDATHLSTQDVSEVLSKCPAPRLLAFNGSAFDTMSPFGAFLHRMGYPRVEVRSSYDNAAKVAQAVETTFQAEHLRPMLIGHSQGGAFVVKVLHALKGRSVSFSSAIATGKWMRVLLGQWDMLPILRKIPATTKEFAGYRLAGDLIGSDAPLFKESGDYEAVGDVEVRNSRLEGPSHLDITRLEDYAEDPGTRAWIDAWTPSTPAPSDARLLFAADIWYHVKKHWCLELQGLVDGSKNHL